MGQLTFKLSLANGIFSGNIANKIYFFEIYCRRLFCHDKTRVIQNEKKSSSWWKNMCSNFLILSLGGHKGGLQFWFELKILIAFKIYHFLYYGRYDLKYSDDSQVYRLVWFHGSKKKGGGEFKLGEGVLSRVRFTITHFSRCLTFLSLILV